MDGVHGSPDFDSVLVNWRDAPPGRHYTWILPPYPEDSFAYQAWAQQAAHGRCCSAINTRRCRTRRFCFHPFFLVSGWIGALTGGEMGVIFLFLKTIGVVLFFVVFFQLPGFSRIEQNSIGQCDGAGGNIIGVRRIDHGAGLGSRWPMPLVDLRLPDVNTFWSLLWNPLFPYSLTLLVLAMHWLDRGTREKRTADFWRAGLATGVLALLHPYSQPLVLACAVALPVARCGKQAAGLLARYFLAAGPFLIHLVLMTVFDPLVTRHDAQGEMKSPVIGSYVFRSACRCC